MKKKNLIFTKFKCQHCNEVYLADQYEIASFYEFQCPLCGATTIFDGNEVLSNEKEN
jgi:Zn finger protein HypA/HybF involved in hydrogenase expression